MPKIYVREPGGISVETRKVPVDSLKLDPENVRFKHLGRLLSDEEMEGMIWAESDTKDLMRSIRASGGLSELPIVSAGNVVKEGNRRVVCLRKLKEMAHDGKFPDLLEDTFDMVECDFLPAKVSPLDLDIYLARIHVAGKKPWDSLNQAKHIYDLYNSLGQSYDSIRDYLGFSKAKVIQKKNAYEAMLDYMKRFPEKTDVRQFVFFDQLFRRRDLREWVEKSPSNLQKYSEWIALGKLNDPSRQLKWLPQIISNPDAVEVLNEKGMDKAVEFLQKRVPALGSATFVAVQRALEAVKYMPLDEYRSLKQDVAKRALLSELSKEIQLILKDTSKKDASK